MIFSLESKPVIPYMLLAKLAELINALMGLKFSDNRLTDLEQKIRLASKDFGFDDPACCIEWLLATPLSQEQIQILAHHLTVGETYFFRQKAVFDFFEQHILSELMHRRRYRDKRLRLWSAGCSTGEEPYSIAMSLHQKIPDLPHWKITILATDINNSFLNKASDGVYGEWAFREIPPGYKQQYFHPLAGGKVEIHPNIKNMITFANLNLVEDPYPALLNNTAAMDVIFCRNVLIYFDHEKAAKVVQGLEWSLSEGGWLIFGPSDPFSVQNLGLCPVTSNGLTVYRKGTHEFSPVRIKFPKENTTESMADIPQVPAIVSQPAETIAIPVDIPSEKQQLPAKPSSPYSQALAWFETGRYAEAADCLAMFINSYYAGSSHEDIPAKEMILLTKAYANQGQLEDALHWCNKALSFDKVNPVYHYLHATILQEMGLFLEAVESLKRTLFLEPDFVIALFALGNILRHLGKETASKKQHDIAFSLLMAYQSSDFLPESEGMPAGRLLEIITTMREEGSMQ